MMSSPAMHWGPFSLRLAAIAVNLFVAAILVLSILPLAAGGLEVHVPGNEAVDPSFEDGVFTMGFPVEIYNGGYFDISDMQVHVKLGQNGTMLTEAATEAMDIHASRVNRLEPTFSFDLTGLDKESLATLVFERTQLELDIGVYGAYALGLVNADVSVRQYMDWEPLIGDLDLRANDPAYEVNGTTVDILVRYSFNASSMLQDRPVDIALALSNANGEIGNGSVSMVLQPHNEGVARITVHQEALASLMEAQDLTLGIDLSTMGVDAHLDREYRWEGMA